MLLATFLCALLIIITLATAQINNVCKNYRDYLTKAINPNCWYNPNVDAPPSEIVNGFGFPFESYNVTTGDGHILTLFRIPHNNKHVGKKRQPVYLQHGIAVSSNVWFDTERSIAYALSREGYDVWIGNFRGTRYSRHHIKYTTQDPEFWNASWPTYAHEDVSAFAKVIKKMTGQKMIYMGHSMGTTTSYVYAIDKKAEAKRHLKGIVSLAPVAYLTGIRTPFKLLVPFREGIKRLAELLNQYGVFKYPHLQQTLARLTCDQYPLIDICVLGLFLIFGFDLEQLPPEDLPLLFSGSPDGFTVYALVHYAQEIANNGRFQRYDYGPATNLKIYGSREPTEFDVKEIDFCVHLIYGKADYLADTQDVKLLHKNLKCSTIDSVAPGDDPPFNHVDFVYGRDVETKLYPTIFKRINDILKHDKQDEHDEDDEENNIV